MIRSLNSVYISLLSFGSSIYGGIMSSYCSLIGNWLVYCYNDALGLNFFHSLFQSKCGPIHVTKNNLFCSILWGFVLFPFLNLFLLNLSVTYLFLLLSYLLIAVQDLHWLRQCCRAWCFLYASSKIKAFKENYNNSLLTHVVHCLVILLLI